MKIAPGLVAAFVVGLIGCGGDDDKKAGGATIGYSVSVTGPNAPANVIIDNSIQLALDEVNAGGGVLGGPLVLDLKDDRSDPSATADIAAQLIAAQRTVIVGPMTTAGALAMLPSTVPEGIVVISPAVSGVAVTGYADNDLFFRTVASTALQGVAVAHYAYDQGQRRAGVISQIDAYPRDYADAFANEFAALGGTIAKSVYYPGNVGASYDYQADLAQVYATTVDCILLGGYNVPTESYLKAHATNGGFGSNFYLNDANATPTVAADVGATAEGMGGGAYARPNNDEWNYFAQAYQARYGTAAGPRSAESYDSLAIAALAIQRAGTIDSAAVHDALREVALPPGEVIKPGDLAHGLALAKQGVDINYEGAAAADDFDANGDIVQGVNIWKFQSGQVTIVAPGNTAP